MKPRGPDGKRKRTGAEPLLLTLPLNIAGLVLAGIKGAWRWLI